MYAAVRVFFFFRFEADLFLIFFLVKKIDTKTVSMFIKTGGNSNNTKIRTTQMNNARRLTCHKLDGVPVVPEEIVGDEIHSRFAVGSLGDYRD